MSTTLDPSLIIGPLEGGIFVAVFLLGTATMQAWIYYERFHDDRMMLKVMVGCVWLLLLGHIISASIVVYTMTITEYGHRDSLSKFPSSFYITYVLTGLIVVVVQNFYALRIWTLTGKLYLPVVCWAWSAVELGFTVYATELGFRPSYSNQEAYDKHMGVLTDIGWTLSAAMDVVTTITLCWYFVSQKSSAMKRTAKVLDRLIVWTLQTGLLTSLAAVAAAITFFAMKENCIWAGVWVTIPGLIVNSCFALLNARLSLRNVMDGTALQLCGVEVGESKVPTQGTQFAELPNSESQNTNSNASVSWP